MKANYKPASNPELHVLPTVTISQSAHKRRLGRIGRVAAGETRQRFRILTFPNPGGTTSYRVQGMDRTGQYIRQNYPSLVAAEVRRSELELAWHSRQLPEDTARATKLTDTQLRAAEAAFLKLDSDDELAKAVEYWLAHGRNQHVEESPLLDTAVQQYSQWLADSSGFRPETQKGMSYRIRMFGNSTSNVRVADIRPDDVEAFLNRRKASASTRKADLKVVSRFFSWCGARGRRWVASNPCALVDMPREKKHGSPKVFTIEECQHLLTAAQEIDDGRGLPYVVACLFGGLRPTEAQRLTWQQVNLHDEEISMPCEVTKTGRSRKVILCPTFKAWLLACEGMPFCPAGLETTLIAIKRAAGFGKGKPWITDGLRHTAISHYFRRCGSYGQTAEWAGNSEAIIKEHYQGPISSQDTKRFYAIMPTKKGSLVKHK